MAWCCALMRRCCPGVVFPGNYRLDGIYLPEDDRPHYVAWCACLRKISLRTTGIQGMAPCRWHQQRRGLPRHAGYLGFDHKAPPPSTQAFWDIVPHNRPPEEAELADSIDLLTYKAASLSVTWRPQKPTHRPSPHGDVRLSSNPQRHSQGWPYRSSTRNARGSWPSGHLKEPQCLVSPRATHLQPSPPVIGHS
jgi:hypothetical protein